MGCDYYVRWLSKSLQKSSWCTKLGQTQIRLTGRCNYRRLLLDLPQNSIFNVMYDWFSYTNPMWFTHSTTKLLSPFFSLINHEKSYFSSKSSSGLIFSPLFYQSGSCSSCFLYTTYCNSLFQSSRLSFRKMEIDFRFLALKSLSSTSIFHATMNWHRTPRNSLSLQGLFWSYYLLCFNFAFACKISKSYISTNFHFSCY